ncbi:putative cytochrome P450 oxidoreductase OrdA-like protein [Hypomontagnella monticulosa]|nr:putative cytochrome P450 oxidoreductase OrdA-like protein [Hypomontagnella monticulosa]
MISHMYGNMKLLSLVISLGIGVTVAYLIIKLLGLADHGRLPLPPGPRGLPLVGNLNDLPKPGVLEAHHWIKHKELYGPISSVTVMGQNMVIINDAQLAFELLEKRSVKYSSRPKQIFAGEMMGWERALGLCPYDSRFRMYRKIMGRVLGTKAAVAQFNTLQEAEVGHFLLHVLDDPENFIQHTRKEAGAVILKIIYGYTADPHQDDLLVDMAGDAMDKFSRAVVPGAFMVDLFPFLRELPDWFPGTGFKNIGRQWGAELTNVAEKPYAFVKHQIAQGKNEVSFISRLLEAGDEHPEEEFANKWSALSLYAGGADTTVSSVASFYLAMTLYPEVQKKAQEEIDRVIGPNRLPTMEDRGKLPYIEATVKEVLRWHPVAPMGLPHANTEDDVYEGYLIPKGSVILANVWHFTHDPEVYDDPMAFKPERFLTADGQKSAPDPHTFVFGFGRRICPGRLLADNTIYLTVAQSLAVFNINKSPDSKEGIESNLRFEPGIVSHPAPYKATIAPRSPRHEALIRSIEKIYPWQESDSKILESI